MKFGKYLESRQLELPEYNGYFIDYKALKKLIKQLAITTIIPSPNDSNNISSTNLNVDLDSIDESVLYQTLQENKSTFFFKMDRELEKINNFYKEKELNLTIKFNILQSKFNKLKLKLNELSSSSSFSSSSSLSSASQINLIAFKNLFDTFIAFQRDLNHFEQFIELNRTGFSKALKKWDKRSHSHEKEFYLETVVSIQPIFTRNKVTELNDETLSILTELNDYSINHTKDHDIAQIMNNETNRKSNTSTTPLVPPTNIDINMHTILPPIFKNNNNSNNSTNNTESLESKLDDWYTELINISKLKDHNKKSNQILSFIPNKIEPSFSNTRLLTLWLTKLFKLLIGSPMDDETLSIFYDKGKSFMNLTYNNNITSNNDSDDDAEILTKKNIFHEATSCLYDSRLFILQNALSSLSPSKTTTTTTTTTTANERINRLKVLLNAKDIYEKTPLHYAAELGKVSFVKLLLKSSLLDNIDPLDTNLRTPLTLAINNNHIDVMELLLTLGNSNPNPKLYSKITNGTNNSKKNLLVNQFFSPISIACHSNNYEAIKLLLNYIPHQINLSTNFDAKGLGTLHIVCKNGADAKLIKLLLAHGADPNRMDDYNKWTPIFYAIQESHPVTVKELLNNGARLNIQDDEGISPLHLVLWESNVEILNILLPYLLTEYIHQRHHNNNVIAHNTLDDLDPMIDLDDDFDMNIHKEKDLTLDANQEDQDFILPPPVIPLRKYGHNYLDKKTLIKISFQSDYDSIQLYKHKELILSKPGRITMTSNLSDLLPRNIILPVGTKHEDENENENGNNNEEKNEAIFQIDSLSEFSIDFEVFPAFGSRIIAKTTAITSTFNPMLLADSTSSVSLPLFDKKLNNIGKLTFNYQIISPYIEKPLQISKYEPYWKSTTNIKQGQIITSSSLLGDFFNLKIFCLNDGTIVCSPNFFIQIQNSVSFFLNDLTKFQLENLLNYDITDVPQSKIPSVTQLKELLETKKVIQFDTLLSIIPQWIQLIIEVCFPTKEEMNLIPVKISPQININKFIDNILTILFNHERELRNMGDNLRSLVFKSSNWQVCSVFNWKQPNFPVLLELKSLRYNDSLKRFENDSPNCLKSMIVTSQEAREKKEQVQNNDVYLQWDDIKIRNMVKFSKNNNLLGVIIPFDVLNLCPSIITAIKKNGLMLIASLNSRDKFIPIKNDEINGIQENESTVHFNSTTNL
ncbi:Pho81p NDAI_0D02550 [Naumovozyma dairenensis CBS 421]|uniref:SPX domain-containing protein n=1 Tax=Naumovozyma dairenensis (strain ATCC 10597 / BCRC 20456 / CBS 421 / NBRC 0211 / NRRL Y-12639) TaxID=1071378 RepID=G0W9V8_NAUDC|nr:hypothetical protein NDAI_0D02550 [Naumovozyma dairenensis CBS 421]CCD24569.1 hypothetical protein NDAI_0D02550 [Naumovozyma dairenensis CBS 421]